MRMLGAIAMSVMRLGPRAPGRTMARVGASTANATAMSQRYPCEGLGRKTRRDVGSFAPIAPASITDSARGPTPVAATLRTVACRCEAAHDLARRLPAPLAGGRV